MALSIGIRSRSILNGHPHGALAALAPDPGITFGLELRNDATHPHIEARSERVGNSSYSLGLKDPRPGRASTESQ
jgi:hypothetical protein